MRGLQTREALPVCMTGVMIRTQWAPLGKLARKAFSQCTLPLEALHIVYSVD